MVYEDSESYITSHQLEHFKNRLLKWKQNILENRKTENYPSTKPDIDFFDVVANQISRNIEIKEQDRQHKTLRNIEQALQRIEDGTYGYCEQTGEPIGINRLEANLVARFSIEAQTFRENRPTIKNAHRRP